MDKEVIKRATYTVSSASWQKWTHTRNQFADKYRHLELISLQNLPPLDKFGPPLELDLLTNKDLRNLFYCKFWTPLATILAIIFISNYY